MPEEESDHPADEVTEALLGLVPYGGAVLGPLGRRVSRRIREGRARRMSRALAAAERMADMSREEIGNAIADDPDLVPLVVRLLYASGMNGCDETLDAMGAALGGAIRDRDRVDEAAIVLGAIDGLQAEHSAVLRTLASPPPQTETGGTGVWWPSAVMTHVDLPERVTTLCVAHLVARGLVRTESRWGGHSYELTELGAALLGLLEELGTPNADGT